MAGCGYPFSNKKLPLRNFRHHPRRIAKSYKPTVLRQTSAATGGTNTFE